MNTSVSIIIPIYNSRGTISRCLESIFCEKSLNYEVILVDDNSSDKSVEVIRKFPCKIVKLAKNSGPGAARNYGAKQAEYGILLFLDSDVVISENTLKNILSDFKMYPDISAVQGIYTKESDVSNLAAKTKNYYKHYRQSRVKSARISGINSFCFAVAKKCFFEAGGFNEKIKTAEDIEFSGRFIKKGYSILLDKNIQVMHIKNYTFLSLLKTDFRKVFAKTQLTGPMKKNMYEMTFSLNRKKDMSSDFLSAVLSALAVFCPALYFISGQRYFLYAALTFFVLFAVLNTGFVNMIRKSRGMPFAAACFFMLFFELFNVHIAVISGMLAKNEYKTAFKAP